jgi:mxaL protein
VSLGTLTRGLFGRRHWMTTVAFLLLIAAVAMPRVILPRDTFSYIVTFDITQSMDVEDVALNGAPVSRLVFARAAMRDAMGQLPCGSKVGWSVFTGQRTLLLLAPVEVCGNFDALLSSLDQIDWRMRWTNWSRIAEGGIYSATRVAQDVGQGAAVVFVTDPAVRCTEARHQSRSGQGLADRRGRRSSRARSALRRRR